MADLKTFRWKTREIRDGRKPCEGLRGCQNSWFWNCEVADSHHGKTVSRGGRAMRRLPKNIFHNESGIALQGIRKTRKERNKLQPKRPTETRETRQITKIVEPQVPGDSRASKEDWEVGIKLNGCLRRESYKTIKLSISTDIIPTSRSARYTEGTARKGFCEAGATVGRTG